jgi:hypothetical protein
MNYTRRSVLRSTALIGLGGAAGYGPLSLLAGCKQKQVAPMAANFNDGVRIFFEGTWLFCADDASPTTRMRAAAVDMLSLPHIFPYGVWSKSWVDANLPSLSQNPAPIGSSTVSPYPVTVSGTAAPAPDVDTLFGNTQAATPFGYIPGTHNGQRLSVDWARIGLRVISMPLPTSIIAAGFRGGTSVADQKSYFKKGPVTATSGVPTTHIFVYDGASNLTFQPPNASIQTMNHGTGPQADYHFHTVPSFEPGFDHSPCMFENLMSLLLTMDRTGLTIQTTQPDDVIPGPGVPGCVDHWELEIPEGTRTHTTASCAAPGAGLGNS